VNGLGEEEQGEEEEDTSPKAKQVLNHYLASRSGDYKATQKLVVVNRFDQLAMNPLGGRPTPPEVETPRKPFKILKVGVQYRYKGNVSRGVSEQQQLLLAPVYVRIMGPRDSSSRISYDSISFVAKDFCVLLQMSKGEVRRRVGEYGQAETKILPVICSHQDGTASTHMLICLTPRGIRRLLGESTFHLAPQVLKWAFDHIDHLCGGGSAA